MGMFVNILVLALLIVLHEGGHLLVARLCGMRVERFSVGFGNPIISKKIGNTIYQIAPIPLGGFVHITGLNPHEEYDHNDPYVYPNRPKWMQLAVLVAGPAANYLTAMVLAMVIFTGFGAASDRARIESVKPGAPAAIAGLQVGDELLAANGKSISISKQPINTIIQDSNGQPVTIKVDRAGKPLTLAVTPEKMDGVFRVGITVGPVLEPVPVSAALSTAVTFPFTASVAMLRQLGQMLLGRIKPTLSGPVRIVRDMADAAKRGTLDFLNLILMLSIYLGMFNLLPVPSLDGGRALFVVARGLGLRQLSFKAETKVHMVGFMLLIGLFLIVTANDLREVVRDLFTHMRG